MAQCSEINLKLDHLFGPSHLDQSMMNWINKLNYSVKAKMNSLLNELSLVLYIYAFLTNTFILSMKI